MPSNICPSKKNSKVADARLLHLYLKMEEEGGQSLEWQELASRVITATI